MWDQVKMFCSECQGKIVIKDNQYVCLSCGRKKKYKQKEKEVDMNDNTKDFDQVILG
ncbi:MAG: hypothetical protein ACOC22_04130 [bacterium]